jgi:NADH-quinone oxidoreductase subunit M
MILDQPRIELLCLLGIPAAMAAVVAGVGPCRAGLVRWLSLATALAALGLAASLAVQLYPFEKVRTADTGVPTFRPEFVPGSPDPQSHHTTWNIISLMSQPADNSSERQDPPAIQFYIGLDGLNIWLIVLTAVLFLPSVLVSWVSITERVNEFYAWLLALQTTLFGVFLAFDIALFYVFFELTLVPLFFLIGIWGGPERRYAARKFLIYTLAGSLITLLGVLGIVLACFEESGELTFSIPRLVEIVHNSLAVQEPSVHAYWVNVQFWVFLALMAGFAIKVPLVPLHTWLPLAHVEAPTAGSVDLAGILLKIGVYGFLRLCVPLAPDASLTVGLPLISILAAIGIVYGAFCAFGQDDIKKLVAYSSVSHLGLAMLGVFALNATGLSGSMLQMINHGLATGALFLLVGMIYDRYHTRKLSDYGGMASRLPLLSCFMVFIVLASIGLPGLNGFISEVLVLMGVLEIEWSQGRWPVLLVMAATTIILGAWYLLTMLRRAFFGPLKEPSHPGPEPIRDLDGREVATLAPVALLCLLLGVYPQPFLDTTRADVDTIALVAQKARDRQSQNLAKLPAPPQQARHHSTVHSGKEDRP